MDTISAVLVSILIATIIAIIIVLAASLIVVLFFDEFDKAMDAYLDFIYKIARKIRKDIDY